MTLMKQRQIRHKTGGKSATDYGGLLGALAKISLGGAAAGLVVKGLADLAFRQPLDLGDPNLYSPPKVTVPIVDKASKKKKKDDSLPAAGTPSVTQRKAAGLGKGIAETWDKYVADPIRTGVGRAVEGVKDFATYATNDFRPGYRVLDHDKDMGVPNGLSRVSYYGLKEFQDEALGRYGAIGNGIRDAIRWPFEKTYEVAGDAWSGVKKQVGQWDKSLGQKFFGELSHPDYNRYLEKLRKSPNPMTPSANVQPASNAVTITSYTPAQASTAVALNPTGAPTPGTPSYGVPGTPGKAAAQKTGAEQVDFVQSMQDLLGQAKDTFWNVRGKLPVMGNDGYSPWIRGLSGAVAGNALGHILMDMPLIGSSDPETRRRWRMLGTLAGAGTALAPEISQGIQGDWNLGGTDQGYDLNTVGDPGSIASPGAAPLAKNGTWSNVGDFFTIKNLREGWGRVVNEADTFIHGETDPMKQIWTWPLLATAGVGTAALAMKGYDSMRSWERKAMLKKERDTAEKKLQNKLVEEQLAKHSCALDAVYDAYSEVCDLSDSLFGTVRRVRAGSGKTASVRSYTNGILGALATLLLAAGVMGYSNSYNRVKQEHAEGYSVKDIANAVKQRNYAVYGAPGLPGSAPMLEAQKPEESLD